MIVLLTLEYNWKCSAFRWNVKLSLCMSWVCMWERSYSWDTTPCRLINIYWRFGGTNCLRIQGLCIPRRGIKVPLTVMLLGPTTWKDRSANLSFPQNLNL
jgi:hypothetical protein